MFDFWWKFIDYLRRRKTFAGQFIYRNKICNVYILRYHEPKNIFRVSCGLRVFKFSFFNNKCDKKLPDCFGIFLKNYLILKEERKNTFGDWNNWQDLISCYNCTGHLNEMIDYNLPIPNYEES